MLMALGWFGLSLVAWVVVGVFWFVVTRGYHPAVELAVIVTVALMLASALAAYVNHLVLLPRYWKAGRRSRYAGALFGTVAILTAAALAVIRVSYFRMHGADADPYGAYKHYVIDFFGVSAHVAAAAGVVWAVRRLVG
jgi:hypothetical protein